MSQQQQLLQIGRFQINKKQLIGKGTSGLVFYATADDEVYCVKIIQKQPNCERFAQREIEILTQLRFQPIQNPNLVYTFEISQDQNQRDIYIIMEYCKDGDLLKEMRDRKKKGNWYTPQESVNIISQIVRGYKSLFDLKFIHRDIKPANILISNGFYKLADFGMGRFFEQNNLTQVGTPSYTAPQIFFSQSYTNKCDVYSLGVVFYELIFQILPITGKNGQEILPKLRETKEKEIKCPNIDNLDIRIKALIEQMLRYDEENRISWPELFNHDLLNGHSVNTVSHIRRSSLLIQRKNERFQKRSFTPYYHNSVKSFNSREVSQSFIGLRHLAEVLMTKGDVLYDLAFELSQQNHNKPEELNILLFCLISYKYFICLNVMGICTNQINYCHQSIRIQIEKFEEYVKMYSQSQEPDCLEMRRIIQSQLELITNYYRDCLEQVQQAQFQRNQYEQFYKFIDDQVQGDFQMYQKWFCQFFDDWFESKLFPNENQIKKVLSLENLFSIERFWIKSPTQILRVRTNSL